MESEDVKIYDGCSGYMSKFWRFFLKRPPPWEHCCDEHDHPYAVGGTELERFCADMRLYFCVLENGYPRVALVMFVMVRYGGVPWLPTKYRWGFETKSYRYKKEPVVYYKCSVCGSKDLYIDGFCYDCAKEYYS